MSEAGETRGGPRTLYLHIGLPKTASTYLQDHVFPSMEGPGLAVSCTPRADFFRDAANSAGERRLLEEALKRSAVIWREQGEALIGRLTEGAEGRSLILSDEAVGRTGSRPEQLGAHLEGIAAAARRSGFERVAVIAMVRRQEDWLASHAAQVSDREPFAGQHAFERLVRSLSDPAQQAYGFGVLLRYDLLWRVLADRFPAEDRLVLPYEAFRSGGEARIRRFVGGALTGDPQSEANRDSNVRSRDGRWRLRPYAPRLTIRGGTVRLPVPLPRGTIAVTDEVRAACAAAYSEPNRRFARLSGLDLSGFGYVGTVGA